MNKLSAAVLRCGVVLLCSCAIAFGDVPPNPVFVAYAEKAYHVGLAKHNAEPNSVEATVQFARVSFNRAEFAANSSERAQLAEPAIEACERLLGSNETNAALHYYLGMNMGELARTKGIGALKLVRQMEKEFIRAAELDSDIDYAGPDRNLGSLYLEAPGWPTSIGNRSKARQHFMRAVQLAPDYPDNHISLLECYLKLGDDSAAQREAQIVFALLPKAREKLSGEGWAADWADWEARWHGLEAKLADKPRQQSPHERK
jgi:tetratricopeptide (TPR) repeat protein